MKKALLVFALTFAAGNVLADDATGFMPWTTIMMNVWAAYDKDHNGMLSMDEVKEMDHKLGGDIPGFEPWFADHYADLDTNHDGVVSVDELHNMMVSKGITDPEVTKTWLRGIGFMPNNQEKPADRAKTN
jgi:hypothetical protein